MIPWLAKSCMKLYCAIFGRHAAHFHLQRIIRGARAEDELQEGVADFGDQEAGDDDDDEDDRPRLQRNQRNQRRRPKLLPAWGRIARKAWEDYDDKRA